MSDLTSPLSFSNISNISLAPAIIKLFPQLPSSSFSILQAHSDPNLITSSKRLAVCFSGGPAPGGHNVVLAIAKLCEQNHHLFGITGGPAGLIAGNLRPLTVADCLAYQDQGGFDLLQTDRTKLTSPNQINAIKNVVKHFQLDAIIIIGGDDSHTNAIFLAQELYDDNCAVIGVPKTIDGDLRYPPYLPISFGYHSACELYTNLVENLIKDTKSVQKYWHFVKLMGRTSSHITQHVAKHTNPDLFFIGEQIAHDNIPLAAIIMQIGDTILESSAKNKPYGVICIPEGLLEWIPDVKSLITSLNKHMQLGKRSSIIAKLSKSETTLFHRFPNYIQDQLLLDRDSHGNIQLSRIETERCLIEMVKTYLNDRDPLFELTAMPHFFGYEGRCCPPNTFDTKLCNLLGHVAGSLAIHGYTGHMAGVNSITKPYQAYGIPIANLITLETRHNKLVPVIKKTVVTDF